MGNRLSDQARFELGSRWRLATDRETVYEALIDFERWPLWWPGLRSVEETGAGGQGGIGQRAFTSWRAPLGYTIGVEIQAVEKRRPEYLRGLARGEVEGSGSWRLTALPGGEAGFPDWTEVVFEWRVAVTRGWMRALAPLARPVFIRSHDYVIGRGAAGLAGYLDCELRGFSAGAGGRNPAE